MGEGERVGDQGPGRADALYGRNYYRRELHRHHWFRDNERKKALRWEAPPDGLSRTGHTVLDLGCAAGEQALRLAPKVGHVIGIDSSVDAIALANERAGSATNVAFLRADATRLDDVAANSVDKILAIDFVEHIEDADLVRMLDSCWRVLRQGGRLAVYTPCRTHYVERLKERNVILKQIPGHVAVRTPEHFERLAARQPWQIADRFFLPSTFPLFGLADRLLATLPVVGPWFQFRYCIVLVRPRAT